MDSDVHLALFAEFPQLLGQHSLNLNDGFGPPVKKPGAGPGVELVVRPHWGLFSENHEW